MKKILIVSTFNKIDEQILDAVESASKKNGAEILNLNNLISDGLISSTSSITQSILQLIKSSDLVVAYIMDYNPNLFYEIGFAHGLGKNVVIIADKSFIIPADLINQKIVILSNDPVDKNQNIFRLEKLFHQIQYEKEISGFQKTADEMKDLEVSNSKIKYEFKDVLHLQGITCYKMFEKWFLELVQGIPAWEVIQAPHMDKGYDFIIWNGSNDNEFNILGNPIPVELKTGNHVNKDVIDRLVNKAIVQGIKGVILLTTASTGRSVIAHIKEIYRDKQFVVIFLELEDLINIKSPKEFKEKINSKLFSLVYGVEDCV
jgi:nucleoside 2-deoxyribosyltransferase